MLNTHYKLCKSQCDVLHGIAQIVGGVSNMIFIFYFACFPPYKQFYTRL
jgi:hypothetical protein